MVITEYQLCNELFSVFRVRLPSGSCSPPPYFQPRPHPTNQPTLTTAAANSFPAVTASGGGRAAGCRWALLLWEARDQSFLLAPQPPSPQPALPNPSPRLPTPKQTNGPQPLSCLANSSVTFQGDREAGKIRPLVRPEEPDGMYAQRNSVSRLSHRMNHLLPSPTCCSGVSPSHHSHPSLGKMEEDGTALSLTPRGPAGVPPSTLWLCRHHLLSGPGVSDSGS